MVLSTRRVYDWVGTEDYFMADFVEGFLYIKEDNAS